MANRNLVDTLVERLIKDETSGGIRGMARIMSGAGTDVALALLRGAEIDGELPAGITAKSQDPNVVRRGISRALARDTDEGYAWGTL